MKESLCNHGVFAIRYPREYFHDKVEEVKKIPYGSWKVELEGKEKAIISVGPMTVKLKDALVAANKNVTLLNAIYLRPYDKAKLKDLLSYKKIIIYNAYATKEGFANTIEAELLSLGYKGEVIVKAVPTEFVKQASIDEQRQLYKLTVNDILELL